MNQFGSAQPSGSRSKADCARCEALLADALDHTLSADEQAVFDLHLTTCADCSRMYMDARRGADWLVMLKDAQPEPGGDLLARILATTGPRVEVSEPETSFEPNTLLGRPVAVPQAVPAAAYGAKVLPFRQRVVNAFHIQTLRHTFMQPRLAMTAAMAFFSIALTMNLTGIHLTQLRASDFTPSSIRRSFYDTNARVARSIDNLRVVYELESRVRDLQQHDNEESAPASQAAPSGDQQNDQKTPEEHKQPAPRPRSGSSRSNVPGNSRQFTASVTNHNHSVQPGSPQPAVRLTQVSFVTPNVIRHHQGGQA
ncbi:MAG: zf-HC2 domain-containing protein [Edaphobacter sp.]|uniref:zf-HC2 domain-containing protein n=1 Tax=Edaphobacter sp. TaxID=1934404 RepID=UPI0023A72F53|nr:zf-HC2 domain-containing protein [Edaphobacter sp.]MDE1178148.1 zf-HC2 domain-containing protein [Edaphobacter sp.]